MSKTKNKHEKTRTWTANAFCHEARYPRSTLDRRLAGVPPDADGGRYTLQTLVAAVAAGEDDEALKKARLRKAEAEAELAEIEVAKIKGEVLGVDVVTRIMSGALLAAKQVILQTKLSKDDQNAVLLQLQALKPSDWASEEGSES